MEPLFALETKITPSNEQELLVHQWRAERSGGSARVNAERLVAATEAWRLARQADERLGHHRS